MKSLSTLSFLTVIVIASFCPSSAQESIQPFSITIRAEENVVKVGSDLVISITLTNTSTQDIRRIRKSLGEGKAEFDFEFEVHDSEGRLVAQTEHYHDARGEGRPTANNAVYVALKPNEALHEKAVLNNLYDISRPGEYEVQVLRANPRNLGTGIVKSNLITVTVQ